MVAVDDHPIVVDGLAALMKDVAPELEWAGTARDYESLRVLLVGDESRAGIVPDVVIYDLNLGDGSDPFPRISELVQHGHNVMVLTSEARPIPLRSSLAAGARGLALKSDEVSAIVDVIRAVSRGEEAVSPEIAFALVTDHSLVPHLSDRELQVLQLLADGLPRKSIGQRLDPPVKLATVATYLNRIFVKYQEVGRQVLTSQDAVREAVRDGYLAFPGEWDRVRAVPRESHEGSGEEKAAVRAERDQSDGRA